MIPDSVCSLITQICDNCSASDEDIAEEIMRWLDSLPPAPTEEEIAHGLSLEGYAEERLAQSRAPATGNVAMSKVADREWTLEQLQRIADMVQVLGPVSDKLSQMTSRAIAELLIEHVWDGLEVTKPQSALMGEAIERLLLQDDFVRGDREAKYEDA